MNHGTRRTSRRSSSAPAPSVRASARSTCAARAARTRRCCRTCCSGSARTFRSPASGTRSPPARAARTIPRGSLEGQRLGSVPHPAQARHRRHGRRVSRRARRRGVPAAGRDQAGAQRRVLAPGAGPAAHGAADPGDAAAPEHRAAARRRARAGRHALPRHGVHRRRADRCVLRPPATARPKSASRWCARCARPCTTRTRT